jgi:CDP-diacylglycerol--glycerol-3-phosphate 3-phosphatidyltransferase
MNTATKITMIRIILIPLLVIVLLFPFNELGIMVKTVYISGLPIKITYIIATVIFVLGSITDFLDGYIARKYDQITDLGKFLDPIADKLLVNITLIILTYYGLISPIITIVLIGRDIIVDALRMMAANKGVVIAARSFGKFKTAFQMLGITVTLMHNIPFEAYGVSIDRVLMYIAVFFSVLSALDYFDKSSELFK